MFAARIVTLSGIVLLLLAALVPTAGGADAPAFIIMPEVPEVLAFANGKMVPAAPIVRAIGGRLTVKDGQLAITIGGASLRYRVGNMTLECVKGREKKKIELTPAPFALNGEVYLPLLSLVTALDGLATYVPSVPGYIVTIGGSTLRLREISLKVEPPAYQETEPQLYFAALDGAELTRLSYSEGSTGLPVISPSGDALVFARFGALYRRSPAESEADVLLCASYDDVQRTYSTPCFKPDGKAILFTKTERKAGDEQEHETVGMVGLDGTGETTLADGSSPCPFPGKGAGGMAIVLNTPRDGTRILRGGTGQGMKKGMVLLTVRRQTVSGLMKVTEVNPAETYAEELADWTGIAPGDKAIPLSQFFTYTMNDGQAAASRVGLAHPTLGPISFAPLFPLEGSAVAIAPDGLSVAWTGSEVGNPVIKVASIVNMEAKTLASGHSPAFSPDGKRIAFIDGNGSLMLIGADGKNPQSLQPSWTGVLTHPAFTPDGAEILFMKDGRLYAIKPGERTARALTKGIAVRDYTFCPDGKHLVLTAVPGTP